MHGTWQNGKPLIRNCNSYEHIGVQWLFTLEYVHVHRHVLRISCTVPRQYSHRLITSKFSFEPMWSLPQVFDSSSFFCSSSNSPSTNRVNPFYPLTLFLSTPGFCQPPHIVKRRGYVLVQSTRVQTRKGSLPVPSLSRRGRRKGISE